MEGNLQFSPIDRLQYDIDEIDHPMYRFSHECVGCVMLAFKRKALTFFFKGNIFAGLGGSKSAKGAKLQQKQKTCSKCCGWIRKYNELNTFMALQR